MENKKCKCVLRKTSDGYKAYNIADDNFLQKEGDIVAQVEYTPMNAYNDQIYYVRLESETEWVCINGWKIPNKISMPTHFPGSYAFTHIRFKAISPDGLERDFDIELNDCTYNPQDALMKVYDCLWITALTDMESYELIGKTPSKNIIKTDSTVAKATRGLAFLHKIRKDYKVKEIDVRKAIEKECNHRFDILMQLAGA